VKTSYEEKRTGGFPFSPDVDSAMYTLTNTAPRIRRKIVVTFTRREGLGIALQFLGKALRHSRWSFFVEHEDPA
jgi:hypothetical protein